MVKKIPPAGESISGYGSLTSIKVAKIRIISVAVESMGFAFVTEKTSIGRELQLSVHTSGYLAAIWLQVRVQIFATYVSVLKFSRSEGHSLIGAFLSSWRMVAWLLSIGKRAIIFSIAVGWQGIIWMVTGIPQFSIFWP